MTIDERIEKMERQLVRVRWVNRGLIACIVLSLLVGLPFLMAGSGVKEIRANRFILEDENGKTRAELSLKKDGPVLLLLDENDKSRAELSLKKDGPNLSLSDENGKPRAGLTVDKDGRPGLLLLDDNGKCLAILSVAMDGPWLALFEENGKVIWKAP